MGRENSRSAMMKVRTPVQPCHLNQDRQLAENMVRFGLVARGRQRTTVRETLVSMPYGEDVKFALTESVSRLELNNAMGDVSLSSYTGRQHFLTIVIEAVDSMALASYG